MAQHAAKFLRPGALVAQASEIVLNERVIDDGDTLHPLITLMRKGGGQEIHLADLQLRGIQSEVNFHDRRGLRLAENSKEITEVIALLELNQIHVGIRTHAAKNFRAFNRILKIAELIDKS